MTVEKLEQTFKEDGIKEDAVMGQSDERGQKLPLRVHVEREMTGAYCASDIGHEVKKDPV